MEYEERLCILQLPYLSDFLMDLSERHFNKIACDSSHPLLSNLFLTITVSSRLYTIPYTILSVPGRKNMQNSFSFLYFKTK